MTTYAIVGATCLPLARVSGHILRLMTTLQPGVDKVIVRGKAAKEAVALSDVVPLSGPDAMVAVFASALHLELEVEPLPVNDALLKDFVRARNIAEKADTVWAFFDAERGHTGGTGHVVSAFLTANKNIKAYDYDPLADTLICTAEYDGEALTASKLVGFLTKTFSDSDGLKVTFVYERTET